jgi:hypothetical protein
MCFYNDYCDWTASVTCEDTGPATEPTRCDECGMLIAVGEPVRHVFQQEHELCIHHPESDYYEGDDEDGTDCPEGCEHEYGQTYEYDCCEVCTQLIEAIHAHEIESGCREHESRPAYTQLHEAFAEGEATAYFAKAEQLYPGITGRLPECFERLLV